MSVCARACSSTTRSSPVSERVQVPRSVVIIMVVVGHYTIRHCLICTECAKRVPALSIHEGACGEKVVPEGFVGHLLLRVFLFGVWLYACGLRVRIDISSA